MKTLIESLDIMVQEMFTNIKPQYPTWMYLLGDLAINGKTYKAGKYTIKSKGAQPEFIPLENVNFDND